MFIDKDNWGSFSIQDLSERELRLLQAALQAYARVHFGRIHPTEYKSILTFDNQYNQAMSQKG